MNVALCVEPNVDGCSWGGGREAQGRCCLDPIVLPSVACRGQ